MKRLFASVIFVALIAFSALAQDDSTKLYRYGGLLMQLQWRVWSLD